MRFTLAPHPDTPSTAVAEIVVEVARPDAGQLELRYVVSGKLANLRLPPAAAPVRGDGLWRHTCFEAFLRTVPSGAYYELNFAPSLQWAAYRFSGYRSGMSIVEEMDTPWLDVRSSSERFELRVGLNLRPAPDLPRDAPWQCGLSAVIEETNGRLSYWALAHPTGKPDFHHSDCFALELPVAVRP